MLLDRLTANDAATDCVQLVFEACRWEANPGIGCKLLSTLRIFFLTCKWHGAFPAVNNDAHLRLENAHFTSVTGGRFTNTHSGHIYAVNSSNLLVGSTTFSGGSYGIHLENTNYSVICGNHFGEPFTTVGNDSVEEGGTSSNNVIMENGIRP